MIVCHSTQATSHGDDIPKCLCGIAEVNSVAQDEAKGGAKLDWPQKAGKPRLDQIRGAWQRVTS